MALVLKMQAHQVLRHGGKVEHTYHAGEKLDEPLTVRGVTREQVTLGAVTGYQGDSDAEKAVNKEWAMATPTAQLSLTIDNPHAMGYVEPGETYYVEIRKARK